MNNSAKDHYNKAIEHKKHNQAIAAISELKTAISIDPNYEDAHYTLAEIYKLNNRRIDEAILEYSEALRINPKNYMAYYEIGLLNVNFQPDSNFQKNAIIAFRNSIGINQDFIEARLKLIELIKYASNSFDETYNEYQAIIRIDPKNVNFRIAFGEFLNNNHLPDAINAFKDAIELDPKNTVAYSRLGETYVKFNLFNDINSLLNELFFNNPAGAYTFYQFEDIYKKMGKINDVITLLKEAIKEHDNILQLHHVLADLYKKQDMFEEAISEYTNMLSIDPRNETAIIQLGELFDRTGKLEEAYQKFLDALSINPNNENIREKIEIFREKLSYFDGFEGNIEETLRVKPIFKGRNLRLKKGTCFVLMPYSEDFQLQDIYEVNVKPVIESNNLICRRADDIYNTTRPIVEIIWENIVKSEIIIAELTGKNANVFYELGIAHTVGKKVILLTQNIDDVPFDLRHLRVIPYKTSARGLAKLEKDLSKMISTIIK